MSIQKTIKEKEEIYKEKKEEEIYKELQIMLKRKEEYRQNRDIYLTKLNGEIVIASFYFNSIKLLASEYREWISGISKWTIDTMPPRSEFEKWRDSFLNKIGANLKF